MTGFFQFLFFLRDSKVVASSEARQCQKQAHSGQHQLCGDGEQCYCLFWCWCLWKSAVVFTGAAYPYCTDHNEDALDNETGDQCVIVVFSFQAWELNLIKSK